MSQKVLLHSECMKCSIDWKIAAMREIQLLSALKYFQPQLLDQISIFFDYFWSIEFSSIRATIMSFKVCKIVSAHRLIQARKELLLGERSFSTVNLLNLDYQIKFQYFSIIFEALNSTDSELQLCLSKYVR